MKMIKKILRQLKIQLWLLMMIKPQKRLAQIKSSQRDAFDALKNDFASLCNNFGQYDNSQLITPAWQDWNLKLEEAFLPTPPFTFLRNPLILRAMFATTLFFTKGQRYFNEQLAFLEKKVSKNKLKVLLQEDYVGGPLLANSKYLTSYASVHHLYNFIRFLDKTQAKLDKIKTIVEWGGGYGNMAKIFRQLKSKPSTYIIIDTPLVSCLQWLYLTTILGKEKVNLLQKSKNKIQAEKINLLPICFLDNHKINADLFISTWALSESPKCCHDYVINNDWFKAKHILLAYQDKDPLFPEAGRVAKIAKDIGLAIEDVKYLAYSHYAFR